MAGGGGTRKTFQTKLHQSMRDSRWEDNAARRTPTFLHEVYVSTKINMQEKLNLIEKNKQRDSSYSFRWLRLSRRLFTCFTFTQLCSCTLCFCFFTTILVIRAHSSSLCEWSPCPSSWSKVQRTSQFIEFLLERKMNKLKVIIKIKKIQFLTMATELRLAFRFLRCLFIISSALRVSFLCVRPRKRKKKKKNFHLLPNQLNSLKNQGIRLSTIT